VGPNSCHQGTESPAPACSESRYPPGIWGYPEQPVRLRIPSQTRGSRRRAGSHRRRQIAGRPGWRSGDRIPPEELQGPATGWSGVVSAARCRDHVSGPGTADRLGRDPGQPSRTAPGAGEMYAVREALSRLGLGLAQRLAGRYLRWTVRQQASRLTGGSGHGYGHEPTSGSALRTRAGSWTGFTSWPS
jgi:hypothetical protein